MEKIVSPKNEEFSVDDGIVPSEVFDETAIICKLLKKKFACSGVVGVENLQTVISIKSGIFTKKDFAELAHDIKSKKVNATFNEIERTITVSSAILI